MKYRLASIYYSGGFVQLSRPRGRGFTTELHGAKHSSSNEKRGAGVRPLMGCQGWPLVFPFSLSPFSVQTRCRRGRRWSAANGGSGLWIAADVGGGGTIRVGSGGGKVLTRRGWRLI